MTVPQPITDSSTTIQEHERPHLHCWFTSTICKNVSFEETYYIMLIFGARRNSGVNSAEQSLPLYVSSHIISWDIPHPSRNPNVKYRLHTESEPLHSSLIQSIPARTTSPQPTSILSFHLRRGLPSGPFTSPGYPTKTVPAILNASHTSYHLILLHLLKAIPLQAWRGPEGSWRLMLPDFKTIDIWRW
jgi:hypothetical protein